MEKFLHKKPHEWVGKLVVWQSGAVDEISASFFCWVMLQDPVTHEITPWKKHYRSIRKHCKEAGDKAMEKHRHIRENFTHYDVEKGTHVRL